MAAVKSNGNASTELKLARAMRLGRIGGWRRNFKLVGRPTSSSPNKNSPSSLTAASGTVAQPMAHNPPTTATSWPKNSNATPPATASSPAPSPRKGWRPLPPHLGARTQNPRPLHRTAAKSPATFRGTTLRFEDVMGRRGHGDAERFAALALAAWREPFRAPEPLADATVPFSTYLVYALAKKPPKRGVVLHPSRVNCRIPCILHEGIFIFSRIILNTQKISRFFDEKTAILKNISRNRALAHASQRDMATRTTEDRPL